MHNLRTVIQFEVLRTLKKKSFWFAALAIPLFAGLIFGAIFFSNQTTSTLSKQLSQDQYSLAITDDSATLSPAAIKAVNAQKVASKQAGQEAVRTGKIDAYFYYPSDISKQPVEVYGKEVGLFKNNRYESLAQELLKQSVATSTDHNIQAVLQGTLKFNAVTYKDGQQDNGFAKVIAPGIFLVLFYFMIATFGNQMLTSLIEEKENRVIEMILATIKPTTLLLGKLFSLAILAFTQLIIIMVPIVAGYLLFKNQLSLPSFDLSSIPIDPLAVGLGAAIFIVSFLMYTGVLMMIGAAMPTAKEAGSFFGAAMVPLFGPLYMVSLFISSPESMIVQILTYFPLTAPIVLLLRNAVGNLPLNEALIALGILTLTTIIFIRIGVRIFRFGALEYSRKLSLQEVIGRKG